MTRTSAVPGISVKLASSPPPAVKQGKQPGEHVSVLERAFL